MVRSYLRLRKNKKLASPSLQEGALLPNNTQVHPVDLSVVGKKSIRIEEEAWEEVYRIEDILVL